jgi:hypothetical protein
MCSLSFPLGWYQQIGQLGNTSGCDPSRNRKRIYSNPVFALVLARQDDLPHLPTAVSAEINEQIAHLNVLCIRLVGDGSPHLPGAWGC